MYIPYCLPHNLTIQLGYGLWYLKRAKHWGFINSKCRTLYNVRHLELGGGTGGLRLGIFDKVLKKYSNNK